MLVVVDQIIDVDSIVDLKCGDVVVDGCDMVDDFMVGYVWIFGIFLF